MKIELEIQGLAWAIRPAKLAEINDFLARRIDGEEVIKELKAAQVKNGNRADQPYQVIDGVAVIPVFGTISKRSNMLMEFSGGTSTQLLQKDISSALKDPAVSGILLDIESPGGSVDGTKELSDMIFSSRGKKPIVAYANGLMCSAAYWIGSAADSIVTNETAIIGSIGVAMMHAESSVADEKFGIRKTEIFAGKYKRIASSTKPLTEEGKAYLQSMVDAYYSIFVDSVARNRGVDIEAALGMSDGKEFIGKQALDKGLVDSMGTRQTAISQIKKRMVKSMDVKTLQETHPDLFSLVKGLGAEEAMQKLGKAETEAEEKGVKKERDRVTEIINADGDPAVTAECIKSGIEAGQAFKKLLESEKSGKAARLDSLKKNAPPNVGQENPRISQGETYEKELEKLIASGKSRADAIKTLATSKPELCAEYEARFTKEREK